MEDSTPAGASPNPVMLILSYLFPLSLIPLFVDKSPDIQFHAKQGTVLWVVVFIVSFVLGFLASLTGLTFLAWIGSLIGLIALVFAIIAIVKGFGGTLYSIPVIGGLVGKVPSPN